MYYMYRTETLKEQLLASICWPTTRFQLAFIL